MKLATYQDGSRDGQLVVVARDLSTAHYATGIANRLQQVLDDWNFMAPQLQDLSDLLNSGKARHAFPFDPARCMAPLPRAYQWASGAAYRSHLELLQLGRGARVPTGMAGEPMVFAGGGDSFLGPRDAVVCASEAFGIDFSAQVAVITGDVRRGASPEQALDGIRLLLLANEVSLRKLLEAEQERGCGLIQGKPATAFSPVAATPDELGDAWRQGRVHLPLQSQCNGRKLGLCDAGSGMTFHFGQLIAYTCKTRNLRAGSIIGSGTVSAPGEQAKGRTHWPQGFHCLTEKRAMETLQDGQPSTDYLHYGDTVRIDLQGQDGRSVFGAIEQDVVAPQ